MSTTYNPVSVMMGNPGKVGVPYTGVPPKANPPIWGGNPIKAPGGPFTSTSGGAATPPPATAPSTAPPANVVGPESVRATGAGPFDSAYRQDLATYAGGLFARPGGNLSFNPTSNAPFGGAATGGGSAPVLGMPNTLLQNALGGNPFTYTPPAPASSTDSGDSTNLNLQDWFNQFMGQGGNQRPVQ